MKLSLIPRPMVTDIFEEEESGILSISENFAITPAKKLEKYVLLIQRDILDILNMDVHIKKDDSTENLFININPAEFIEAQSYRIVIDENGIELCGADETGLFYAIQTFKQLLLIYGKNLQYMEIEDEPGYSWRGLHIDVSRHFFPISFLKKIVNMMALLKLNRFHWHLTDDQGWRIESFKFPNLHETGACRNEEGLQKAQYYTQDEIRDFA
ncbi:MAG TPA: family 20 glycosylhydrolase, partial [Candidatus Cloacimonadota bacterium]|nr:family 20 glycosylhydrolase [Candidatus Cloacimonadota bacterium]